MISVHTVEARNERRIRILFTNTLDVGAFTSTSYYTVDSVDNAGAGVAVSGAIAVSGIPSAVELALASNMVPGGIYRVSAVGVPDTDGDVSGASGVSYGPTAASWTIGETLTGTSGATAIIASFDANSIAFESFTGAFHTTESVTGGTSGLTRMVTSFGGEYAQNFLFSIPNAGAQNSESITSDVDALIFGEDLIFNGTDYQEDATGDLARIGGTPNAMGAVQRRTFGSGLPYDPNYGPEAEQYVNSPAGSGKTLKGALIAEARKDPRVQNVNVELQEMDDGSNIFIITPTLINGRISPSFPVTVPNAS